jgi:hypothetical protein
MGGGICPASDAVEGAGVPRHGHIEESSGFLKHGGKFV